MRVGSTVTVHPSECPACGDRDQAFAPHSEQQAMNSGMIIVHRLLGGNANTLPMPYILVPDEPDDPEPFDEMTGPWCA